MRTNASLIVEPEDAIKAVTCTVDGQPIIRFGDVSVMLTWDQLRKVHAECLKLEASQAKEAA